jgi:hypothetical protein
MEGSVKKIWLFKRNVRSSARKYFKYSLIIQKRFHILITLKIRAFMKLYLFLGNKIHRGDRRALNLRLMRGNVDILQH